MKHPGLLFSKRCNGNSSGIALFLAISLLALFSVLGASYMRYMSLELEETELRIRDMRIRHYATAGINSAAGHIHEAIIAGETPSPSYAFSYAVYGQTQQKDESPLQSLSTYTAEAQVAVEAIEKDVWDSRFVNGASWPGAGRVFRLVSKAAIQRAVPGRIITVAHHSVEAILVAEEGDIFFFSRNTVENYDSLKQSE